MWKSDAKYKHKKLLIFIIYRTIVDNRHDILGIIRSMFISVLVKRKIAKEQVYVHFYHPFSCTYHLALVGQWKRKRNSKFSIKCS